MEYLTVQEAATYRMLTQVLQNHLATPPMSCAAAVIGGGLLVGALCVQLCAAGDDPQTLLSQTLRRLKQHLRTPQEQSDYLTGVDSVTYHPEDPHVVEQALLLSDVLGQLLDDAGAEKHIALAGRLQIALCLMAELLRVYVQQYDETLEAVEMMIDGALRPALATQLRATA
jgi:hypothetical protein